MVKRILIGFLLCLFTPFTAVAQESVRDPYDGGEKYWEIRPYKVTTVKSIKITKVGERYENISSDETPKDCAEFRPRERDVREFFQRARRVSYSTYWNELDMSRCHAAGEIAFMNGDRGTWIIDAFRRGVLTLSDGRNIYFFCTKCRAKVFYEY
jgi:hypothetical protein